MDKKLLLISAVAVGMLFVVISIIYFTTPAKSLPSFFPGFDPALTKTHFKHGIGALFLGISAFVFAWFKSGKKSSKKEQQRS
ncbi:MAG: hypothetical protein M1444_03600 [Patescibacteria group bacterium]|nr:hypothetical protein [Patescibacteria group bacterium]